MNDEPSTELAVFTAAVRLSAEEQAAYLARECGDDHSLRARVEALLRANSEAGHFMEQSPGTRPDETVGVIGEKTGDHIGRYRLLQQIGEGGCGVVFMAEQEEPVRRRVALKIIKPGMDTKSVIARFEAERQALALMDHPNIAKVFDAGATELGRPFFVMELIRGIKITDYCDQNRLSTPERLELFVQVCQAVQHAHQKGIIHRDIKPSNILVTTTDQGVAVPMVIDFGIAKPATNQRLTGKTLFTGCEMLIGTPSYMSPEQAALTSVGIDTRTDIYSLGVLLFELLSGSTPFDTTELSKSGLDEIRRVILEVEPVRPSTCLSRLAAAELTRVALIRRSEPSALIRAIHGDLDWIVMKAMDIRLPDRSGMQVQRDLLIQGCPLPIIFITGHGDIPMSVQAMKAGAIEFLTKPFRNQDLLEAVQQALDRDRTALEQRTEMADLRARYSCLTQREREIMRFVISGAMNKLIAFDLGTSEINVKIHRSNMMKKLRVSSIAELVWIAQKLQIQPVQTGSKNSD
jgi:FixJ family two-component response regulator/tRNA A-37 threonylcarbamoyl transferase component Bud32